MVVQVKMSRMRQRIAQRLKEAQNVNAMLTTFNEVDMRWVVFWSDSQVGCFSSIPILYGWFLDSFLYCGFRTSCNAGIQTVIHRQPIRLLACAKTHMQTAQHHVQNSCSWKQSTVIGCLHDSLNTHIARSLEFTHGRLLVHSPIIYRIAGNFCRDFNLANWQIFLLNR